MRLSVDEARSRFAAARVARLATVRPDGAPHLVPVTFAVTRSAVAPTAADAVVFIVDDKPKSTTALQRLVNIAAEQRVSLLVDHYDDDWSALWWVRADAVATVATGPARRRGLAALTARYPHYVAHPPAGLLVVCEVRRWVGWAARRVGGA